tara:strand:+ start:601 stop:1041 length:441 start_codon:yes stop_codon:yes gene_type:complete
MYNVGQILYTILENKHKVLPVKVVEQVVTKTLEGETIKYTLELPNSKKTNISIEKLSNIYTSIEEVKDKLTENANNAISNMIYTSKNLEKKFFKEKEIIDVLPEVNNIEVNKNLEEDIIKVDLGDGQIGKININNINPLNMEQKKT